MTLVPDRTSMVPPGPAAISGDDYRDVLGRFASGPVIIAADTESGPVGFTCQSFFSVSLDPPLVAISVRRGSTTWEQIKTVGRLSVSVLSDEQHDLAQRFGRATADKLAGVGWTPGTGGPQLDGALAHLSCTVESVNDAGDHYVVIGRVTDLDARHGHPLLFFRGRFGRFHPRPTSDPTVDASGEREGGHTGWGSAAVTRRGVNRAPAEVCGAVVPA
ncbi:flavin reductase family protein [Pseudonocardia sp. GCM10023141]|uniref:flavin reductase family protein n=1 Tax=Pseudonocardia sp. GCM10023141 TaxID=3252653 RepID=UPI00361C393C